MKRTKLRRFLPILVTLLTVIVFAIGITATAAEEEVRSNQITHANLVLDNDVDLVFWADITEADAQNGNTFMTFNDSVSVSSTETRTLDGVTYAIFKYNNIAPKDLPDVVNAKLYVNGVYTSYIDYSVKNYCQYILTYTTSDTLKALVSDLLVYGEKSQEFVQESPDTFVTNGVIGLTPSKAPDSITVLYDKSIADDLSRGATASLTGSQLFMDNGIELHFEVELPKDADPSEYTVCLTINGREQEVPIISKVTLSGYENRVSFKGIYSYELFDEIEINVYKNSYRVSNTMKFSLASYIKALNEDAAYTDLTNAYYNYCYSSHIYAGTHTVVMPGNILPDVKGNTLYDDSGKIAYNCSLCGREITALTATHIRNFDDSHTGGSPANNGTYTVDGVDYKGTFFSLDKVTETSADGVDNKYFAITYNPENNKAVGSLGYYITYNQARPAVSTGIVDSKAQYDSKQFTFAFDVKAPAAGLSQTAIYLRNVNAASNNSERFGEILTINPDGSIVRGSTKIAPHSTVKSSEWITVTVTMDLYENNGESYIFLEYYINDVLATSFSITNPMYEEKFTCLYFSISNSGLYKGQGILLDNIAFAQGLVHSFSEDIVTHIANLEGGSIRKIIDKVQNDFDIEDFSYVVRWDGKSERTTKEYQGFVTMDRTKYNDPDNPIPTPTSYDHPRVLFNSSDIPNIVANIEAPENALAKNAFLALVNSSTDGKLSDPVQTSFEYTNYNTSMLKIIEAKALFYALYKDNGGVSRDEARLRGYEAIYAMKNYLLTFDVQWKASDQCRYYGELMYYSALVYDWCYDLLTDDDKEQFMVGVQNLCCDGTNNMPWAKREGATGSQNGVALNTHEARKLEGGFPALAKEDQSRLTGHGAEAQVLRDYFSFAIAIFDEDSSWYSYVGGMIYKEYVDARNYFYTAGFYPDGSGGYNQYRFLCDLYNAWLFEGMGVELPYTEDMATVVHGFIAMETYNGYQFASGDGAGVSSYGQSRLPDNVGDCALISAYLFDDPAALAIAHYVLDYRWNRGSFSSSQLAMSAAYYLILTSDGLTPAEDYREKVDDVEYHGAWQQQVVARNGYNEDSVVVLMQGGQHLPGGHTHQNSGSFQIWYKGMLTRDDGLYDAYGSDHHHYYHAAAVAHNTLLIYNPARANIGTEPVGRQGFYNGGQRAYLSVPATYSKWIDDDRFSYGKVIGFQTDSENDPSYVYYANDITNAYESDTVDYVERSFMTVYTGDEETPMVMFVFDNITSDGADFQKTFLLQCATAPVVDTANSTVTVDNGEGKLVLTSLLGNDTIKAYGRTSKDGVVMPDEYFDTHPKEYMAERFYLSGQGKSVNPGGASSIGDKNSDLALLWGHVEIQPEANSYTNQLMNVIYVSDSGTTVTATPTLIQGTNVTGATFKNHTSVFLTDPMRSTDALSFTAAADAGIDTMTYYVGGLSEGSWKVFINGEQIYSGQDENGNDLDFTITEDGRMLTFTGAVGEVRVEPGEGMRPQGAVGVAFNLNGGKWNEGEEPLGYYIPGTAVQLPTPTKKGAEFGGWYTDKNFQGDPITEIPATATEVYRLYAKWTSPLLYVDYTKDDYSQISSSVEAGGGTTWGVTNDPVDGTYFLWSNTGSGSILQRAGAYGSYANQSLQVSYTLSLGRHGSINPMPLQLYFRDDAHNRHYANIFSTDASGNVYLGLDKIKIGEIASSGISSFHFVLDFAKGRAIAYDDNGNEIVNTTMSAIGVNVPLGCKSFEDWFRTMTASSSSLFALKGRGAGTIRVYALQILSGNLTDNCKNFGTNSDKHNWDDGVVISHPSSTDCTPGVKVYTCQNEKCGAVKEVALTSEIPHQGMTSYINANNKLEYECTSCGCTFLPGAYYYLNGSSHDGIIGVGNSSNFSTKPGTNQPAINAGAYELLNTTGKNGNVELWVPGRTPMMGGFSAENNAIGFVSFKVNALTTNTFDFNFVDTSSTGAKWSSDWCITDAFFRVFAPTTVGNKTTVKVTGWDGVELANIELRSEMSFTDWLDVKIYIELDKATDKIILHYYINGSYKATVSRELTTTTNAINSICITGSTSATGSGIKLDDIAFGFTANGAWAAPKN